VIAPTPGALGGQADDVSEPICDAIGGEADDGEI